jgi:hypothetical protein
MIVPERDAAGQTVRSRCAVAQELTGSLFEPWQPPPDCSDCEQSAPVQPVAEATEAIDREEAAKAAARRRLFTMRML